MRTLIAWTLTLALGIWVSEVASAQATNPPTTKARPTAPAQGKAAPARPAPLDPAAVKARQAADQKAKEELEALLVQWEAKSKQVTSLSVGFLKVERSLGFGDQYFEGNAQLKPDRACLEIRKYKVDDNGKALKVLEDKPTERIVCNGQKVLQYAYQEQTIYVFPLDKEVRQKALQEGPLPFLFNMKAEDVKKRYGMSLLETTDKAYVISILPNEDVDRQTFSRAILLLDKTSFLPSRLVLYTTMNPKGDSTDYTFKDIFPNRNIPDALFQPVMLKDWKVILNPGDPNHQEAVKPAQGQPAGAQQKKIAIPTNRPVK